MASLTEELIDRVGFLTILIGLENDRDSAIRITESVDAKFLTVDFNESVYESFGFHFESGYIPETIFIDRDGNIITSIVGGNADQYRQIIENALNG